MLFGSYQYESKQTPKQKNEIVKRVHAEMQSFMRSFRFDSYIDPRMTLALST